MESRQNAEALESAVGCSEALEAAVGCLVWWAPHGERWSSLPPSADLAFAGTGFTLLVFLLRNQFSSMISCPPPQQVDLARGGVGVRGWSRCDFLFGHELERHRNLTESGLGFRTPEGQYSSGIFI